jgi:hypothetical protein
VESKSVAAADGWVVGVQDERLVDGLGKSGLAAGNGVDFHGCIGVG